jgi:hypothetical protein
MAPGVGSARASTTRCDAEAGSVRTGPAEKMPQARPDVQPYRSFRFWLPPKHFSLTLVKTAKWTGFEKAPGRESISGVHSLQGDNWTRRGLDAVYGGLQRLVPAARIRDSHIELVGPRFYDSGKCNIRRHATDGDGHRGCWSKRSRRKPGPLARGESSVRTRRRRGRGFRRV